MNMKVFFIWELLILIYVILIICSPELNGHTQLFSTTLSTSIMWLVCHVLAGEGHGTFYRFTDYCPQFFGNQTHRRSHCLHSWDPAEHLRFVNPCNSRKLDRSKRSWLATAVDIWNECQLMWFYREKFLAGALYWKIYGIVYVLDLLCMSVRFITVRK